MATEYLLLLILLPSVTFSISTVGIYTWLKELDWHHCPDGKEIFRGNSDNILQCAKRCNSECSGVFYQKDTQLCIGCSSVCGISNQTEVISGSTFHKRLSLACPVSDSDWIPLPEGCSKVQIRREFVSQLEATALCSQNGANLIKINETWKMDFIVNMLRYCEALDGHQYWVDGSNRHVTNFAEEYDWEFSDGSSMPTSSHYWAPGLPKHSQSTQCIRIVNSLFNDRSCDITYRFICEKQ